MPASRGAAKESQEDSKGKGEEASALEGGGGLTRTNWQGYVTDFLGIRTKYDWDCATASVVPSRRFDCERHSKIVSSGAWETPLDFVMPAVDEEYFEWIDVLASAADNSRNLDFVVVGSLSLCFCPPSGKPVPSDLT